MRLVLGTAATVRVRVKEESTRRDRPYERLKITGIRGLTEAQKASLRALGAFEETRVGK